jgi:hypothetical protein
MEYFVCWMPLNFLPQFQERQLSLTAPKSCLQAHLYSVRYLLAFPFAAPILTKEKFYGLQRFTNGEVCPTRDTLDTCSLPVDREFQHNHPLGTQGKFARPRHHSFVGWLLGPLP